MDPRFVDAGSAVIIVRRNTSLFDEFFGHSPVLFLMLTTASCQGYPEPGMLDRGIQDIRTQNKCWVYTLLVVSPQILTISFQYSP